MPEAMHWQRLTFGMRWPCFAFFIMISCMTTLRLTDRILFLISRFSPTITVRERWQLGGGVSPKLARN